MGEGGSDPRVSARTRSSPSPGAADAWMRGRVHGSTDDGGLTAERPQLSVDTATFAHAGVVENWSNSHFVTSALSA